MEKKKIVVVGCTSEKGQSICKKLATSTIFNIVAGFDSIFSTALDYPFRTCVVVDELRDLTIDIIVVATEVDEELRNFALSRDIPIVNEDELEKYLAQVTET